MLWFDKEREDMEKQNKKWTERHQDRAQQREIECRETSFSN